MIVLGIETSTTEMSLALVNEEGVIATFVVANSHRHVEALHLGVLSLCAGVGRTVEGIDGIAVDRGPGLFTGMRVGIVAAKALAIALGIPIVAPNAFDVLRATYERSRSRSGDDVVVPTVDLRRREIAFAISIDGSEEIEVGEPLALLKRLRALPRDQSTILIGDGAIRHQPLLEPELFLLESSVTIDLDFSAPSAVALALLGRDLLVKGESVDPVALLPTYLRAPDAQANFVTRSGAENSQPVQDRENREKTEPIGPS